MAISRTTVVTRVEELRVNGDVGYLYDVCTRIADSVSGEVRIERCGQQSIEDIDKKIAELEEQKSFWQGIKTDIQNLAKPE